MELDKLSKLSLKDTAGKNINQLINPENVGKEFVKWFFTNINTNINNIFTNIWKDFSLIDINGVKTKGKKNIEPVIKKSFSDLKFKPSSFQFVCKGSRSILNLVTGTVFKGNQQKIFTFMVQLNHNKNAWFIQNLIIHI